MRIEKYLPKIQKNIPLAKHTTFKIGGPAKYFFIAKTKEELIRAVKWAKGFKLPFFVLGGGSNVLALDEGFDGLIIKTQNSKLKIQNHNSKLKTIYVEAGTKLDDLVKLTARQALTGLEWAAGIPGTVGGAVYGNNQAFDIKMSDIVESVEVINTQNLKIKNLSKKQCKFSNKNSIFKKNRNLIILSAILKLKKGNKKEIKNKIKKHFVRRKKNHPLNFPSAGSVFINKNGTAPSGYLIEKAGLKGTKIGKAEISKKHAGFIVNLGGAKAKDVLKLIELTKRKVKNKFGINLQEEVQIIK